ncbi:lamin tail domain-containing protein [candidate division KSB1 bacterium]|nr:lamin tail domain-containing protein [candidate division KSB1 bacterium]
MSCSRVVVLSFFLAFNSFSQIVLSEIMFNPQGNERHDEFIELCNVSETDAVDLIGWLLSDGTKFNTLIPFSATSVLLPKQYAIILVPLYFQASASYDAVIPQGALILTIAESQFGANGLKNSGEIVSIYTPDTTLVGAYQYTPDNKDGFSEEKIDLEGGDSDMNWSNSARLGGTPGYANSIKRRSYDLALTTTQIACENISSADSVRLFLGIKNVGKLAADCCTLVLHDSTQDRITLMTEKMIALNSLAAGDSLALALTLAPLTAGFHSINVRIDFALDEKISNNSARIHFQVCEIYPPACIVINEIMYDTDEKSQEWIEILNHSHLDIDIANWRLRDTRKSVILTRESCMLEAGSYCILTNNELDSVECERVIVVNLPELNNTGDSIVLLDAVGVRIDSMSYDRSYGGGRFISLERIRSEKESCDPDNWSSCRAESGSTPGQVNSASPKDYDAAIGEIRFQPAQPHDGDDVRVTVDIVNAGRYALEPAVLTLSFESIGDRVRTPIGDFIIADTDDINVYSAELVWSHIPAGIHIVTGEIKMHQDMLSDNNIRSDTITVSYLTGSMVINEIMYSPIVGECEWVELYNRCDLCVELMNWSISDSDSLKRIPFIDAPFLIPPQHYIVIGQDSSILEKSHSAIVCAKFPSLGNEEDDVILYDGCGRIIDGVSYTSAFGGERGRSLERINPHTDSEERTNWTTCVHSEGHTAGHSNSIAITVMPKMTSLFVSPNPFSPDGDGVEDFAGIFYSLPAILARVNLKIFDMNGRLVRFLLNNSPSGAERTVYWDGLDESGVRCRMGIYIILLQALNESQMRIECAKKTVVLAGRL